MSDSIRINKFLSRYGASSRRYGDELIRNKEVFINDKVASLGDIVTPNDRVYIKDKGKLKEIKRKNDFVYLAFNKPLGITSTTSREDKTNIIDYINYEKRIFPIGRLDKNSHGLILLTNDGEIVNKILRSENNHEKEYIVKVTKAFDENFLRRMRSGVKILNTLTKPCKVKRIDEVTFKIILTQGLNRQIRRMCEALGYRVCYLKRIRVLNITLGNLKLGEYRHLKDSELKELFSLINYN